MPRRPDYDRALAEVQSLLDAVDSDLDRMPRFKFSTPWHTDRIRARQGLLDRRELLQGLAAEQRQADRFTAVMQQFEASNPVRPLRESFPFVIPLRHPVTACSVWPPVATRTE
jgi:hypothetical protein